MKKEVITTANTCEAKIIIEMQEKLLTRGGIAAFTFCATFKMAINIPKTTPDYFFSRIYS